LVACTNAPVQLNNYPPNPQSCGDEAPSLKLLISNARHVYETLREPLSDATEHAAATLRCYMNRLALAN